MSLMMSTANEADVAALVRRDERGELIELHPPPRFLPTATLFQGGTECLWRVREGSKPNGSQSLPRVRRQAFDGHGGRLP